MSELLWQLRGDAMHHMMKQGEGVNELAEEYITIKLLNREISGTSDLYDKDGIVNDWKETSVWTIIYQSQFEYWIKQLNYYAYLFHTLGFPVNGVRIVAMLRDWSKMKALTTKNYPISNVWVHDFKLNPSFNAIKAEMEKDLGALIDTEKTPDDDLPVCSSEERWYSGDKFAIKKEGRKSAVRVLDSEKEAKKYITDNKLDKKHSIESRPGVDKKCTEYCSVNKFCSFWKEKYGSQ